MNFRYRFSCQLWLRFLIVQYVIGAATAQDPNAISISVPVPMANPNPSPSPSPSPPTITGQPTPGTGSTRSISTVGSTNFGNNSPSTIGPVQASSPPPTAENQGASDSPMQSGQPSPSPSVNAPTPSSDFGQSIVKDLISSFVPGAGGLGGGSGPFGLLPTISKLSTPLAHMITSNGKPTPEDLDQLLKALPDVGAMLALGGMLNGGGANSLGNIFSQGSSGTAAPTDLTKLTPQQINDMISGAAPLPPISSLPPEYVSIVMSGGSLPGITVEQTQALKQRYMQQMFNGGGQPSGSGQPSTGSAPVIGTVFANISISQSSSSDSIFQELKNLDLSKLPPDVVQSFLNGQTPDLSKIPPEFLQSIINSPKLFAKIVSQELQKKINNESSDQSDFSFIGDTSGSIGGQGPRITYDVNSLDKKADISMYRQAEDDQSATLWTAIVLGVVAVATVILIAVLCWRRQRNRRNRSAENRQAAMEGGFEKNAIVVDPKTFVDITSPDGDTAKAIRENQLSAQISQNIRDEGVGSANSAISQRDGDVRASYTQQWVFGGNPNPM